MNLFDPELKFAAITYQPVLAEIAGVAERIAETQNGKLTSVKIDVLTGLTVVKSEYGYQYDLTEPDEYTDIYRLDGSIAAQTRRLGERRP